MNGSQCRVCTWKWGAAWCMCVRVPVCLCACDKLQESAIGPQSVGLGLHKAQQHQEAHQTGMVHARLQGVSVF